METERAPFGTGSGGPAGTACATLDHLLWCPCKTFKHYWIHWVLIVGAICPFLFCAGASLKQTPVFLCGRDANGCVRSCVSWNTLKIYQSPTCVTVLRVDTCAAENIKWDCKPVLWKLWSSNVGNCCLICFICVRFSSLCIHVSNVITSRGCP